MRGAAWPRSGEPPSPPPRPALSSSPNLSLGPLLAPPRPPPGQVRGPLGGWGVPQVLASSVQVSRLQQATPPAARDEHGGSPGTFSSEGVPACPQPVVEKGGARNRKRWRLHAHQSDRAEPTCPADDERRDRRARRLGGSGSGGGAAGTRRRAVSAVGPCRAAAGRWGPTGLPPWGLTPCHP